MTHHDHIATVFNTPNSIPQARVDAAIDACMEHFIALVVGVVREVSTPDLTVDERNLIARTVLADIAGALRPLARMLSCEDGAVDVLPAQMREICDAADHQEVMRAL